MFAGCYTYDNQDDAKLDEGEAGFSLVVSLLHQAMLSLNG